MSMRVDANMFVGQFPFRSVARADVTLSAARMDKVGLTHAVVSPMEAVFHEDSFAAEAELAEQIKANARFIHFKVVNPMAHWWERDLDRAVKQLNVRGIRLVRTYHEYELSAPRVAQVMACAAERGLPVLVMCKMQDYRMQWLLRTSEAEAEEVGPFLDKYTKNRLILAGLHYQDMRKLADTLKGREDVLLDTSRLKGPWRTFEHLGEVVDLSQLAFGSLWPINVPECALAQIRAERISEEVKEGILGGNFVRCCGLDD